MKCFIISLILLSFSVFSVAGNGSLYTIHSIGTDSITIDGKLREPSWLHARYTDDFVLQHDGSIGKLKVNAAMLWDDDFMYIGMFSEDPDIYAEFKDEDSHFYIRDDIVEIFIDPDGSGYNYIEIGISPKGIWYDYIIINPMLNNWQDNQVWDIRQIDVATQVLGTINDSNDRDSGWYAEIKIPLGSLDHKDLGVVYPIISGMQWRLNLYRIDYDHKTPELIPNEEYAWCMTGVNNPHIPSRFGTVKFSDNTKIIQDIVLPKKGLKHKLSYDFESYKYSVTGRILKNQAHNVAPGIYYYVPSKKSVVFPQLILK